jgi:5-methyltetrahydropteroyltriglutamate--homocysteine methyltransferase
MTTGFEGLKKGPMYRWFNTNTFYFAPVVEGPISTDGIAIWKGIKTEALAGRPFKVVIPDPLTFAELSEDKHYGSPTKLMFAYAEAINAELATLESKGLKYVQFSSPSLVARFGGPAVSTDVQGQLAEALRVALDGRNLESGFHTFFGDASPYIEFLFDDLPVDDVGVDLTLTPADSLPTSSKGVLAGVSDARSSHVETPGELIGRLDGVGRTAKFGRIVLCPSSDLQYVPRDLADAKMRSLSQAKETLRGE